MNEIDRWVGRLSIVGATGNPPERLVPLVLERCRRERTLAVACRNLGLPCPEGREVLARQILAARQAGEILERVEAVTLKGLDLAHRLYPSPSLRDMGDIDLLVRRSDLPAADAALRALGYASMHDAARLAASPDGTLNAVEYVRGAEMPVHLHWHVSNASLPHFMYRIDVEEIWSESRDGRMAPHHQVVTLCEHALKHSFSELILLTDIELAARGADARSVAETARRWGLERAVCFAATLLRELMGVEVPALREVRIDSLGWADRLFLRWAMRRRWSGLSALGFLAMSRGAGEKMRFVRETLRPRGGGVEALRSRSAGGRILRAVEMIRAGLTSP